MGELRREVIERDRVCVAALLDKLHMCRDRWGDPHESDETDKLTLEHVKFDGVRFDDDDHCVAMCNQGNVVERWSSNVENNRLARAYLAGKRAGERRHG